MAKKKSTLNRKSLRQERQATRKRQKYLRIGIAVVDLVLLAGYFLWPRPKALAVRQERLNDDPYIGSIDALVTIVEYGDFGCPSCRA